MLGSSKKLRTKPIKPTTATSSAVMRRLACLDCRVDLSTMSPTALGDTYGFRESGDTILVLTKWCVARSATPKVAPARPHGPAAGTPWVSGAFGGHGRRHSPSPETRPSPQAAQASITGIVSPDSPIPIDLIQAGSATPVHAMVRPYRQEPVSRPSQSRTARSTSVI